MQVVAADCLHLPISEEDKLSAPHHGTENDIFINDTEQQM
jgi:hypothetical protein